MVRKILHILGVAALMTSCADALLDEVPANPLFLNGKEKTPIAVQALLDAGSASAQTRAADMTFDSGDQFVAYLRHVTWEGGSSVRNSVEVDQTPCLVTFTKGSTTMAEYSGDDITPIGTNSALCMTNSNTKVASDLTAVPALYWDDFSEGAQGGEKHLRTDKHYLQSYYGYCFNGSPAKGIDGSCITTALDNSNGILGWTVQANQNVSKAFQHSDLLWSAEQTPIPYTHGTTTGDNHGTLMIPFTHAMSKVTVELVLGNGFAENKDANLNSATVVLKNVKTSATYTAPTATVSDWGTSSDVIMHRGSITSNKKNCTFTALIAPTQLKDNLEFAEINQVDGNNYKLVLTDAVLKTATSPAVAWNTKLVAYDTNSGTGITPSTAISYDTTNGGLTIPGVNYHIKVTLDKQEITVNATITNWNEVKAEGEGKIQFTNDIVDKTGDLNALQQKSPFQIYQSNNGTAYSYATTYTYEGEHAAWGNEPAIYWPDNTQTISFRALTGAKDNYTMQNGDDRLWGTTKEHEWGSGIIAEGAPVHPRTGKVELTFYHPMAKVTFNLEDANKDVTPLYTHDNTCLNPHLDLEGATVQIIGLANTGTIDLKDGTITLPPGSYESVRTFPEEGSRKGYYPAKLNGELNTKTENLAKDYVVIPQTFKDNGGVLNKAYVLITLADGTTYKIKLNTCQTLVTAADGDNPAIYKSIDEWEPGKHYIYTITLAKETIKFRALVKDWEEKTGSGNATLEWD